MNAIVRTELDNIVKSGPRDEDFKKSQDNILKRHTENLQENVYWLTTLIIITSAGSTARQHTKKR